MIKSEDEHEVIEHVKEHAKEKHDMDLSDDEGTRHDSVGPKLILFTRWPSADGVENSPVDGS